MSPTEKAATDDLFTALAQFDGLDTFCALPPDERRRFVGWIVKAQDDASYWSRIEALVLAMRYAPLQPGIWIETGKVAESPR